MAVCKRLLRKDRLRQVPHQFSWIDHRLVRDRHIGRCCSDALALYLFLVTVADGQGLSYYGDAAICRILPLDAAALSRARQELMANELIAYQRPLYQVLALPASPASPPPASAPQPKLSRPPPSVTPAPVPRRSLSRNGGEEVPPACPQSIARIIQR